MANLVSATEAKEPEESPGSGKLAGNRPQISTIPSPSRPAMSSDRMAQDPDEKGLPSAAPPSKSAFHGLTGLCDLEDESEEEEEAVPESEDDDVADGSGSQNADPDLMHTVPLMEHAPENGTRTQNVPSTEGAPIMENAHVTEKRIHTESVSDVPPPAEDVSPVRSRIQKLQDWKAELEAKEVKLEGLKKSIREERPKLEQELLMCQHNHEALDRKSIEAEQQHADMELRRAELNLKQIELANKRKQLHDKQEKLKKAEEKHYEELSRHILDDKNEVQQKKEEFRQKERNYQEKYEALTKRQQLHRKATEELAAREEKYAPKKQQLMRENPWLLEQIQKRSSDLDAKLYVGPRKSIPTAKPLPPAPTAPPNLPTVREMENGFKTLASSASQPMVEAAPQPPASQIDRKAEPSQPAPEAAASQLVPRAGASQVAPPSPAASSQPLASRPVVPAMASEAVAQQLAAQSEVSNFEAPFEALAGPDRELTRPPVKAAPPGASLAMGPPPNHPPVPPQQSPAGCGQILDASWGSRKQ